LDEEQEGFRRSRGTTDALLRIAQDIGNGFNAKEHTAALFIDIEKAYDSVWCKGLMYKLSEMGITGRTWSWINNFLTDRRVSITMGGVKAPDYDAKCGLPQGSVISPLLFNLFISDWYKDIGCEKVKFADDGTIWKTGENWLCLMESLQQDFKKLTEWARKWRLKLSLSKTEFCMFSLDTSVLEEARKFNFSFDGKPLKYNSRPKLLGLRLDEKLKFDAHLEDMERKALRTVEMLRKVFVTEKIDTKCRLQLYKALVTPQLEYASAIWQTANCSSLEKVQRKGLALCLGVPLTAGVEALEVEAGVRPLDIRREELAIRQAAKIMMKDGSTLIKQKWENFIDREETERKVTPFGAIEIQVADMCSNTGISLHNLEKGFTYVDALQPTRRAPEYWHNLGSSKTRTADQNVIAKEIISRMVESCDSTTVVAFTDGSCLGNPGPCGAGACVYPPGGAQPVHLKQPVSVRGSILLGELVAIKMVVRFVANMTQDQSTPIRSLHIFSDSQSAIGNLTLGWKPESLIDTVREVKGDIKRLEQAGVSMEISWTPGHAQINGNEMADRLAKEAAEEARQKDSVELPVVTTLGDVKTAARQSGQMKWQERWENTEKGRHLYQYRPEVGVACQHSFQSFTGESVISQLRSGYVRMNEYLSKVGATPSSECQCGEVESVEHYLLHCPIYDNPREILKRNLVVKCGIFHVDLHLLLDIRKDKDANSDWRGCILQELEAYVAATNRFAAKASSE